MTMYVEWNTSRPAVETWGFSYYKEYRNTSTGF